MQRNYNKNQLNDPLISIFEIKNGNKLLGKLLYNNDTDKIIFRNKIGTNANIVTESQNEIIKTNTQSVCTNASVNQHINCVQYCGLWISDKEYQINSLVKYKFAILLSP